jgi:hypothetical protein
MEVEQRTRIRVITWNSEEGGWGADIVRAEPYDVDELLHVIDTVCESEEDARDAARSWLKAEGITEEPTFM